MGGALTHGWAGAVSERGAVGVLATTSTDHRAVLHAVACAEPLLRSFGRWIQTLRDPELHAARGLDLCRDATDCQAFHCILRLCRSARALDPSRCWCGIATCPPRRISRRRLWADRSELTALNAVGGSPVANASTPSGLRLRGAAPTSKEAPIPRTLMRCGRRRWSVD
jgi:hypothetical protein